MRAWRCLLGLALALWAPAQEPLVVDRVVAVINGEVITLGQLRRTVAATATLEDPAVACGPSPNAAGVAVEQRVLECMIDDLLQFQYVRRFPQFGVAPRQIDAAFAAFTDTFDTAEAFQQELDRQQKTTAEVRYDLEREALVSNYINARYRSVIAVDDDAVRRYYEDVLRPEMERRGAAMPEFETVDDEFIAPMLFEMEVNRRVDDWIADLRRRADIVIYLWQEHREHSPKAHQSGGRGTRPSH